VRKQGRPLPTGRYLTSRNDYVHPSADLPPGGRQQGRHTSKGGSIPYPAALFDEIALSRQELHQALDDTREQDLELFRGRGAHGLEYRQALGGAIDPIEHGAMEMNIEQQPL
jgi:hypothetical protein